MRFVFPGFCALIVSAFFVSAGFEAGENQKPKYTIPQVMAKAMKGGLCRKVASGKGSEADKKQLVEYFTALSKNTPPMGSADSWKAKTTALLTAAEGVLKGDAGAAAKLQKAANCAACHSEHKS